MESITEKVYKLLAGAFGVRLNYDDFTEALDRHNTDSKRQYLSKALRNLNTDEQEAFIALACSIFTCDGEVTQGEKEFMYGFFD